MDTHSTCSNTRHSSVQFVAKQRFNSTMDWLSEALETARNDLSEFASVVSHDTAELWNTLADDTAREEPAGDADRRGCGASRPSARTPLFWAPPPSGHEQFVQFCATNCVI